jgi:NADPH:quinone reductase-like Zn-dependent oxidoreductase
VAAITALQGVRDQGQVKAGQRVLINGASGGVGTFAVQIAKSLGADVTGVCSTRNVDLVKSLGADRVIDYTKEDFTLDSARYDVIIDNVGNRSFGDASRVLSPTGTYVLIGGGRGRWLAPFPMLLSAKVQAGFTGQDMKFFIARLNETDLQLLHDLVASGRITPTVDRTFRSPNFPKRFATWKKGARAKVIVTVES